MTFTQAMAQELLDINWRVHLADRAILKGAATPVGANSDLENLKQLVAHAAVVNMADWFLMYYGNLYPQAFVGCIDYAEAEYLNAVWKDERLQQEWLRKGG